MHKRTATASGQQTLTFPNTITWNACNQVPFHLAEKNLQCYVHLFKEDKVLLKQDWKGGLGRRENWKCFPFLLSPLSGNRRLMGKKISKFEVLPPIIISGIC